MSLRYHRLSVFLVAFWMLLSFSSCSFNTTVVTNADEPDMVISAFFSSLKQKNYDECDKLFSDVFTIKATNTSGSAFTEALVDQYIDNLDYQLVGDIEINGINAKQKIQFTTFGKAAFLDWIRENKTKIERNYLSKKQIAEVDHQNTDEINDMLIFALYEYADNLSLTTTELDLSLRFSNNRWLIVGDQNLIEAIYGGISDE